MSYTTTLTITLSEGEVFYSQLSQQGLLDTDELNVFRRNQPGYIDETFEMLAPLSSRLTYTFEDEVAYTNYVTGNRLLAAWQRRKDYYETINYTQNVEHVDSTASAIEP